MLLKEAKQLLKKNGFKLSEARSRREWFEVSYADDDSRIEFDTVEEACKFLLDDKNYKLGDWSIVDRDGETVLSSYEGDTAADLRAYAMKM